MILLWEGGIPMNIEKVLDFIQREIPSQAEEISFAINLLSSTIENTRCTIDGDIGNLSSKREFEKASEYIEISKELAEIMDIINQYIKEYILNVDELQNSMIEDDEEEYDLDTEETEKVDYEKYRVNEGVAYDLYTNFTHKKPAAFSLDGVKYPARQWKLVFTRTCEILFSRDELLFNSFVTDLGMQGKRRAYFSTSPDEMLKPKKIIGTNIYVETNLSANAIRIIIIDMLEKYRIPKNKYLIYLSKDLTPLHIEYNNSDNKINLTNNEITDNIQSKETEIANKEGTKLVVQKFDVANNNDDFRFIKAPYVCNTDPLINHLTEKIGTPSHFEYLKMSEGDVRRHKARCIAYDHKTGKCKNTKSPYFTMNCGGASRCKFYHEYANKIENNEFDISKPSQDETIEILSNEILKKKKCPYCNMVMTSGKIRIHYNEGKEIKTYYLNIYNCKSCGKKYIYEDLFNSFSNNKEISNLSYKFRKDDKYIII